jgi:hypothetical protein
VSRLVSPRLVLAGLACAVLAGCGAGPLQQAEELGGERRPEALVEDRTKADTSHRIEAPVPQRSTEPYTPTQHVPVTLGAGWCETLIDGAVGFENETGMAPNAYRAIGETVEGRSIWAEHWGSTTGPQVLVIAQVHGDECSGAFVAKEVRTRPPATWGVWLVASLNPDGFSHHTRKNANRVDLNRDGLTRAAPETQALLKFTAELQPVLSVHVHTPLAWVGSHNGGVGAQVADRIAELSGLPGGRGAGSGKGFLWEGQDRVLAGHPSVLVELPAMTRNEASAVFARGDGVVASVAETRSMAAAVRDALTVTFGS